MFMKKANKKAAHRDQVMQLQIQRDTVKKNIRRLRNEMQRLVEQAVSADDLDRRILSLEYDEKKAALGNETSHFNELSKLISQFNGVELVYERQRMFDQIATVVDAIDTQAVLRTEDMVTAQRTMLQEESEALEDMLKNSAAGADEMRESAEFTRLVRDAQLKKAALPRPEVEIPVSVEA